MENHIFEKIIAKEIPAYIVYEDEHVLSFLDINPTCEGHTLVIPKKRYVNMFDIPEDVLQHFIIGVKKTIAIVCEKMQVTDVNILNASGENAQQSVGHLHFHIIPRKKDDHIDMWPQSNFKEIDVKQVFMDYFDANT